jgi:hypothetical protein
MHLILVMSDGSKIDAGYVGVSTGGTTPPAVTTYTVTFKDWNGSVLKTETVESGKAATAPTVPTRKGYAFTGWDQTFNNVTGNLVVTAQYAVNITGPAFVLESVETYAGATEVELTVSIKNNPGLLGAILQVSYDPALKLEGAGNAVSASGVTFTKPTNFKNPSTFVWDCQDANWTQDGEILTLVFSVPPTVADGDYNVTLTYNADDVFDGNGEPVDFAVINAVVKVR